MAEFTSKVSSNQNEPCNHEPTMMELTVGQALHLEAFLEFAMENLGRNAELEDIKFEAKRARQRGVMIFATREANKKFGKGQ
jgi:hypothetical protein